MNMVGSRPDGWWKDRDGAVRRLVNELVDLDGRLGPIVAVIDGTEKVDPATGDTGGMVKVLYAGRRGPDSADDRIVELLEDSLHPDRYRVITSDRALAARCRAEGADVMGVSWLLRHLRRQS